MTKHKPKYNYSRTSNNNNVQTNILETPNKVNLYDLNETRDVFVSGTTSIYSVNNQGIYRTRKIKADIVLNIQTF